jgi:5-methylcytosine-specific restriction endonuclease McrA
MRPVEKKIWIENNTEIDRQYSPYGNAKDDLIENLGKYCSFCEVPVPPKSSLEVEHVQPKSLPKYFHLEKSWSNFLLGCKNCNSVKSNQDVVFSELHLPHKNNTALSFQIKEGGLIEISGTIDVLEKQKAQNTLNLVGIDRRPGHPQYSKKDDRWQNRYEAWNLARIFFEKYKNKLVDIDTIIHFAIINGFFSVWMKVFENDLDIRQALIDNFKGTAKTCFNIQTIPINRNGLSA